MRCDFFAHTSVEIQDLKCETCSIYDSICQDLKANLVNLLIRRINPGNSILCDTHLEERLVFVFSKLHECAGDHFEVIHNGVRLDLIVHELEDDTVVPYVVLNGFGDAIKYFPGVIEHVDDDVVIDADHFHRVLKGIEADLL